MDEVAVTSVGGDYWKHVQSKAAHWKGGRSKSVVRITPHNVTKFQQNLPGTYGSAGRNILIGPGLVTFDLMLNKKVRLWSERKILELRWDVFNAMNRAHFSNPNAILASPSTFGQITSTGAGRIIQISMKLSF